MKKYLLIFLLLTLMPVLPALGETSYMDFVKYSIEWLGDDPDGLWRMTRNDVRSRLQNQDAFACKALYDSSAGKSYYLCRSSDKFSGKYRMRFYFSNTGLLEAVEFRAEDSYIRELADCYDGQVPTVQTILQQIVSKYGGSGRYLAIENSIFTDSPGKITAQAGIGTNTYAVFGQNVLEHSFDRPAVLYVFCSAGYASVHARK